MIDQPTNSVKLVEFNTIASSFGVLAEKTGNLQEYIKDKYGDEISYKYPDKLDQFQIKDESESL